MHDRGEAAVKLLHPGTLADPTHVAAVHPRGADRVASSTARTSCACSRSARPPARSRSSRWSGCAATTSRTSCAASAGSSSPQAATLVEQIAAGLEAARAGGHRPPRSQAAQRVPRRGRRRARWKILDFGVSKPGGIGHADQGPRRRHARPTWRPSRRAARTSTTAPTSTRSPRSSIARSPGIPRSPARTSRRRSTTSSIASRRSRRCSRRLPGDVDRVLALGLAKDAARSVRDRARARRAGSPPRCATASRPSNAAARTTCSRSSRGARGGAGRSAIVISIDIARTWWYVCEKQRRLHVSVHAY